MTKFKDLTGQKFERLTVIKRVENNKYGRTRWLCKCDCGNETIVTGCALIKKHTQSCGCYHREELLKSNITHNLSKTRIYKIWSGIKKRCYNKKSGNYYNYGKRNIIMCEEWKNDFVSFYNWAINNGYKEDLTIDRIDVNGNYEPSNCRWADIKMQNRNTRNNIKITYNNKTHCLSEWAEILDINYNTLHSRVTVLKQPIEKAFTKNIKE